MAETQQGLQKALQVIEGKEKGKGNTSWIPLGWKCGTECYSMESEKNINGLPTAELLKRLAEYEEENKPKGNQEKPSAPLRLTNYPAPPVWSFVVIGIH